MLISEVLRTKGHNVVKIRAADSIRLAVRMLAEHRIGSLVVEDQTAKLVGIFSERDFINAIARDGAAVLGLNVQELMTKRIVSCRSSDRVDAALATMTNVRIRHLPVIDDGKPVGIVCARDALDPELEDFICEERRREQFR